MTQGFLRGNNISAGDWVHVATSDHNKIWMGRVTESQPDQWGTAWFFELQRGRYSDDPSQDNTVTVTVTTSATPQQSSDGLIPSPSPTTVP